MKFKSIKSNLRLFIVVIVILTCCYLLTLYFNAIVEKADEKYHQILGLEKDFSTAVLYEKIVVNQPAADSQLKNRYASLQKETEKLGFKDESRLLTDRVSFFKHLVALKQIINNQHDIVRKLMPDMVESVRYIHEHHIVYLKNLMRRGHETQDWDIGEDFKRSPVRAAPELETIKVAVNIQNQLLDVFSIFYKLHFSRQPSALKEEFQARIKKFYVAVNTFEDYSLDAQDGLLVEELLISGHLFEDAFTVLLSSEIEFATTLHEMEKNGMLLLDNFQQERKDIQLKRAHLKQGLLAIQFISISVFLSIIFGLSLYVYSMMRAFKRTTDETNKIRQDIEYKIPVDRHDYEEFRVIFEALNAMARTIETQINDLKKARSELTVKVKERTIELEKANEQLKKEIADRIASESERLELEAKLHRAKKMEAIGLLAGGVAHDLNNILSGIVSYPELMLLDLPEDSPLRKPILTIKQTGEKAATIVQDLLTLSRSGIRVTEQLNINTLIEDFLESPEFRQIKSYHEHVQVRTSLQPELLNIIGSPVHLSKTIMNLVINALEAMPDGGQLSIETQNQYVDTAITGYDDVTEGDYVVIRISDNGIGIAEKDLERIFEPFYTKKAMGRSGTGLGMAVVWGTVKDHNGYIDIASELAKGTQIKIYLPASRLPLKESRQEFALDEIKGRGQHILVIDDVAEQREIASKMLEILGYQVDTVSSGEAAVAFIRDKQVDLIILDMIMTPGMDGFETYQKILETNSGQKAIIASGYSETERVKKTLELGAGAYIRKPYTLKKIGLAVFRELNPVDNDG